MTLLLIAFVLMLLFSLSTDSECGCFVSVALLVLGILILTN